MTTLIRQSVQAARSWVRVALLSTVLLASIATFGRHASAAPAPAVPSAHIRRTVGPVTASYPPNAEARVHELLDELPQTHTKLQRLLGHALAEPVDLRFVWAPEEMAALAPADAPPPRYATGVSYPAQRLAIVALADPRSPGREVARETLVHELAHVALAEAAGDASIPRWFHEGFAIHAAAERSLARYEVLAEAAAFRRMIPLETLDEHFADESFDVTLAYAEAGDVLRFLTRDGDRARFVSLLERLRVGVPFDRALGDAYGIDLRKLDYEWRGDAAKRFAFLPILTGGSLLWVVLAVVFVFGWARKRREAKATLARWDAEEAEARRLTEFARYSSASDAPVPAADAASDGMDGARTGAPSTVSHGRLLVEHDGRWHTLH